MSNPNSDFGEYILNEIIGVGSGKIITYQDLVDSGVDSVYIEKHTNFYKISAAPLGEFERFMND